MSVAGERVCNNKQVRSGLLEEAVWDDICQLLRDPDHIRREYERRPKGGSQQMSARQKQLETMIHKTQRAIARRIDVYEEGLLTKEEFEPRIRASKSQLSKLQEEAKALSAGQSERDRSRVVIDHLKAFQEQLSAGRGNLDWQARREVIRSLVQRVEIDHDEVRVVYEVSPPLLSQAQLAGLVCKIVGGVRSPLRRGPRPAAVAFRGFRVLHRMLLWASLEVIAQHVVNDAPHLSDRETPRRLHLDPCCHEDFFVGHDLLFVSGAQRFWGWRIMTIVACTRMIATKEAGPSAS